MTRQRRLTSTSFYIAIKAPAKAMTPQSTFTNFASLTLIPSPLALAFGPVMDVLSPAAVTAQIIMRFGHKGEVELENRNEPNAHDSD